MREIKFRVPVICQNGHKAFWYYRVDKHRAPLGEMYQIGVPRETKCDCPKFSLDEGWNRNGDDEQFTGLKDKNGVEIYEGDIVAFRAYLDQRAPNWKRAVTWKQTARYTGFNISVGHTGNQLDHYEVIGNIYENPGLLEQS